MSAPTPSPVVAVLGTGALGTAMAVRLVDEGFTVRVWNRTERRTEAAVAERPAITAHGSLADAVAGASAVLTVVRDESALQDVADQLLPAFPADAVWIQASTVGPDAAGRAAERASASGVAYLDAPVSGSTAPARAGKLVWLVSGSDDALAAATPVLDALGSAVRRLGTTGREGNAAKIAVNAWMAAAVVAASDVYGLADKLGLSHEALRDAIGAGALAMPYALQKMAAMDAEQYSPGFSVELALKDVRLAATDAEFTSPLFDVIAGRLSDTVEAGNGALDVAAVDILRPGRETL